MEAAPKQLDLTLASLRLTIGDGRMGRLAMDVPGEPINVINLQLVEDFEAMLDHLEGLHGHDRPLGLIVVSEKSGAFLAGADLKLIRKAATPEEGAAASRRIQRICDRIAALSITTVAVIDGPALGGGLEIALACDRRIAADSNSRDIGLVEVQLGLLPAGGGTLRLPKLIGPARAIPMILASRRLSPRQAQRVGIVDETVHRDALERAASSWATNLARTHSTPPRVAERLLNSAPVGRGFIYRKAANGIKKVSGDRYQAPCLALDAIRKGLEGSFSEGAAAESRHFGCLAVSTTTRNLIDLFLDAGDLKREQSEAYSEASPEAIGIVAAGLMGAGIGQAAAMSGMSVRFKEIDPQAMAAGLKRVDRLNRRAERSRRITCYEGAEVRSRISGSSTYSGFGRTPLIVEAAVEDTEVKRSILADLEAVSSGDCVIGTNTSAIPIGVIAAKARRPENVVGIHFFSPAHRMPLVEVIRGPKSGTHAVGTAIAFGRKLGKHVVVVGDGPGFFTTRVLGFMMSEAVRIFEDGASIEDIDSAMVRFGFPMGPMALMDEVGLDVAGHVADTLASAFPDRLASSRLMERISDSGRHGKRDGRGFYLYTKKAKRPDPSLNDLGGRGNHSLPSAEIQERLSLLFVNEAARCLGEGVIACGRDGDIASIFGIGFPPFLGGPFRYVDLAGAGLVADRLRHYQGKHGSRFEPAEAIVRAASDGGRLRSTSYALDGVPNLGPTGELIGLAP